MFQQFKVVISCSVQDAESGPGCIYNGRERFKTEESYPAPWESFEHIDRAISSVQEAESGPGSIYNGRERFKTEESYPAPWESF